MFRYLVKLTELVISWGVAIQRPISHTIPKRQRIGKELRIRVTVFSLFYSCIKSSFVLTSFGFEGRTLVLITSSISFSYVPTQDCSYDIS